MKFYLSIQLLCRLAVFISRDCVCFFPQTMEFSQVISVNNLPVNYKNVVVKEGDDFYEIRSNVMGADDIISWCSAFGKNTNTAWIVNHTIPDGERMVCK